MGRNYFNVNGDMIVELRTMFRQVGWIGQSGVLYAKDVDQDFLKSVEKGGFSPIYQEIAVDRGQGWEN